jgi:hypothetical protein
MRVLGIDPDSKFLATALVLDTKILEVNCFIVRGSFPDFYSFCVCDFVKSMSSITHVVIEGQQIYAGSKAQPNDLLKLAIISGMWAGACAQIFPKAQIIIPKPREWKGSIDKATYQARMYHKLGWGYEKCKGYSIPVHPTVGHHLSNNEWKHVGDALGLALWGLSNFKQAS